MIDLTQMGQSCDEGGEGTVSIGRRVKDDIGGSMPCALSAADDGFCAFSDASLCLEVICFADGGSDGRMGGGRSMFSAAFLDSWRAKSDACHHSRNFRANMLVGNRILRELNNRGCMVRTRLRGERREPPSPGRAGPALRGAVASAMALWSASPSLRILEPIAHMKGEWYFVPSNRYAMLKTSKEK